MGSVSPDALARGARMQRPKEPAGDRSGWTWDARAMLDANDADLEALNITATELRPYPNGAKRWQLSRCPYSQDHDDGAFRMQLPSGYVEVKCQHDRCQGKSVKSASHLFPHTMALKGTPPVTGGITFGGKPIDSARHRQSHSTDTGPEHGKGDAAELRAKGERIDGAALLERVAAFLARFVSYPSEHARTAHALWIAHTHMMAAWDTTPRLAFLSPEPASGKTRALEITELLVPRPIEAVNMSAAALFRLVAGEAGLPTVLYDEIDTVFGNKHTAEVNEDVRGLLNAGHRRGAKTYRSNQKGEILEYEAFSAVALAGLGDLPDTILTRSVIVRMRRRAAGERVEPYRRRVHGKDGHELRDDLAAWAAAVGDTIGDAWPVLPSSVQDRDADVWEPLIAVADMAGGEWPQRARDAAEALVRDAKDTTLSLGIRLLSDIRTIFEWGTNVDQLALHTDDLLKALHGMDEAPWAELTAGKPINARGLASRLNKYGVKSCQVTVRGTSKKGYRREHLADAWARYLTHSPENSETSETSETSGETRCDSGDGQVSHPATETKQRNPSETFLPRESADVSQVTHVSLFPGGRENARACVQCGEPTTGPDGYYCSVHAGDADDLDPTGTDDWGVEV